MTNNTLAHIAEFFLTMNWWVFLIVSIVGLALCAGLQWIIYEPEDEQAKRWRW